MVDRPDLRFTAELRSGAAQHGKQRRRRRLVLLAAGFLSAAALFVTTVWIAPGWLTAALEKPLRDGPAADGYLSVVVVGIDERAHDPGRTDAILVASLRLDDGHVGVVSVPRDTRVKLPGGSHNKVNMLFTAYGPHVLMDTLAQLLGVPIDGYVKVNFQAFERFVDAIGGVELTVPSRMRYVDRAQNLVIDLRPGRQRLSGKEALEFVRFRADGLGDVSFDPGTGEYLGRVERQQEFTRALFEAVTRRRVLLRLPRVLRETYAMVETDMPLDLALAAAGWVMRHNRLELSTGVLPGMPGTVAGASYWLPDRTRVEAVARRALQGPAIPGSVAVLNANGVQGSAAQVASVLSAAGIRVEFVGNARQFGLDESRVLALTERGLPLARQVARILGGLSVERAGGVWTAGDGPEARKDVIVLVGIDLVQGIRGSEGPATGGETAGVGRARQARGPRS